VDETRPREDTIETREESARHVLHAYRERRRRRRGEDTFFGSRDVLVAAAEGGVAQAELDRRRSSILEDAAGIGMPADLAALLYDVAREEGLDPALAFELVATGLGVAPPADGVSTASAAPTVDKYLPSWMFPAEPPDQVLRERMLRVSFRRLRGFLEDTDDVDEAFRRFAHEPDVGHFGY
jgi:hypothetical protein